MSENTSSETTEQQIERAVTKKIISGVQSVSVDGMTTSFQSCDDFCIGRSTVVKSAIPLPVVDSNTSNLSR